MKVLVLPIVGAKEIEHDDFPRYRQEYGYDWIFNERVKIVGKSGNTFKSRIEWFAEFMPSRLAFVQGDKRVTWGNFNKGCNRLANALLSLGVEKEDRVGVMGYNSIEWVESFVAASKIGAVPVNINPKFVPEETKYILEDSDATVLIAEEECVNVITKARKGLPGLKHIIIYGIGKYPEKIPGGCAPMKT